MPENRLASLSEAENRPSEEANPPAPLPATHGDAVQSAQDPQAQAEVNAKAPDATSARSSADQVDAVVTQMEPEKDQAAADKAKQPVESATTGGTPLNAGSVDNKGKAPDAISQATGHSPASSFPAPTPTRDSAVHQLDLKIAELAYYCNDFNHQLDPGRQSIVDAIKAYKAP